MLSSLLFVCQYVQFGQQSIEPPPAAVSAAMTPVTPVNPFGMAHTAVSPPHPPPFPSSSLPLLLPLPCYYSPFILSRSSFFLYILHVRMYMYVHVCYVLYMYAHLLSRVKTIIIMLHANNYLHLYLTHQEPGTPLSIPGMLPPINTNRMPPTGLGGSGSSPLASPVTTPSGQLSPSLAGGQSGSA